MDLILFGQRLREIEDNGSPDNCSGCALKRICDKYFDNLQEKYPCEDLSGNCNRHFIIC